MHYGHGEAIPMPAPPGMESAPTTPQEEAEKSTCICGCKWWARLIVGILVCIGGLIARKGFVRGTVRVGVRGVALSARQENRVERSVPIYSSAMDDGLLAPFIVAGDEEVTEPCLPYGLTIPGFPGSRTNAEKNTVGSETSGNVERISNVGGVGWQDWDGSWLFPCEASLISPRFVLTAASCSRAVTSGITVPHSKPKIVRFGGERVNMSAKNYVDANIIKIIVHPKYRTMRKLHYDIAIMALQLEPSIGKFNEPFRLPPSDTLYKQGGRVHVGRRDKGNYDIQKKQFRMATGYDVEILSSSDCMAKYPTSVSHRFDFKHHICTGSSLTRAACQGNPGTPLVLEAPLIENDVTVMVHFIIGVTSVGEKCADTTTPGIYTRVSNFAQWIEVQVTENI